MKKVKRFLFNISLVIVSIISFFCFSGFTGSGQVNINHNGKGSAELTIASDKSLSDFKMDLNEKIQFYNLKSGADNMLVVESVKENDGQYIVKINFRRIDKIKASAEFDLSKLSEYGKNESQEKMLLEKFSLGNLSCTIASFYNGKEGSVTIPRTSRMEILPKTAAGQTVTIENFFEEAKGAKDNEEIFVFRMVDVGQVTSAKISFPGKITYYAGNDIKLISSDTVEIKPSELSAEILSFEENAAEPTIKVKDIGVMFGYVVYEESLSPLAIIVIVLASVLVVGVCILIYVKCRKTGLKILAEQAKKNENIGEISKTDEEE